MRGSSVERHSLAWKRGSRATVLCTRSPILSLSIRTPITDHNLIEIAPDEGA